LEVEERGDAWVSPWESGISESGVQRATGLEASPCTWAFFWVVPMKAPGLESSQGMNIEKGYCLARL
jgi:hypothetical protein